MGIESKEDRILELFLNEPSRHWHFSQIVETAKISEPSADKWLKKMVGGKLIQKVKTQGKMPYFIADFRNEIYRTRKKIYALEKMYESGLMTKLQQLKNTKAVVIFGSFARSDWNTQSDVDIFVLGDPEDLKFGILWSGLGLHGKAREVQVHSFKSIEETRNIRSGLMKNVAKGYFVKGSIFDIAEVEV